LHKTVEEGFMNRRICLLVIALLIVTLAYLLPGCDTLVTEKTVIIEAGHPIADFVAEPTLCCSPCTVEFADSSRGPRQVWIWDFGDNKDSVDDSTPNPVHIYDTAGIYHVMLTILDTTVQDTGRDTEVKNYYIIVGAASADFDAKPDTACSGQEIIFWPPESGSIFRWEWHFGDDSSVTFTDTTPDSITHIYDSVGSYWVKLTVTDTCGSRTDSNQVIISICPEVAFSATYPDDTMLLSEGCKPLTVDFHDVTDTGGHGPLQTFHWDFGDGHQESGLPDVTHVYDDTGTFVVVFTASSGGPEVTATDTIRVYDSTTAAFIAESPTSSCYWPGRQFQVKFKSQSLGKIDTMIWHFGDGDTLYSDSNPVHAYDPGVYICSLEVYGICGIDTMADTFAMADSVILADVFDTVILSITPPTGDTSVMFTFADESEGIILSRKWVIDTITVDNAPKEIPNKFTDTGWYYISLTISNNCDTAEVTDSVYVSEP
jgi:PKD repeat protein